MNRFLPFSQGHRKGGRAEQLVTAVTGRPLHGRLRRRDPASQAAASGARESRPAGRHRQRRQQCDPRVPAPVQEPAMELFHEEFPAWQEPFWEDRRQRCVEQC